MRNEGGIACVLKIGLRSQCSSPTIVERRYQERVHFLTYTSNVTDLFRRELI